MSEGLKARFEDPLPGEKGEFVAGDIVEFQEFTLVGRGLGRGPELYVIDQVGPNEDGEIMIFGHPKGTNLPPRELPRLCITRVDSIH